MTFIYYFTITKLALRLAAIEDFFRSLPPAGSRRLQVKFSLSLFVKSINSQSLNCRSVCFKSNVGLARDLSKCVLDVSRTQGQRVEKTFDRVASRQSPVASF